MWVHLGHFLGVCIATFFDAIGTTLLGRIVDLAFAVSLAVAILYKKQKQGGWRVMLDHWSSEYRAGLKFALGAAVVIYTPVIIWSVGKAAYVDHTGLSARLVRIRNESTDYRQTCTNDISNLKSDSAVKDGINRTLDKQNRDQQGTINGCLSQAMKLLTPEEQKISALIFHSDQKNKVIEWIVLINKTIQYPRILVSCNQPVLSADLHMVGDTVSIGGPVRVANNAWEIQIVDPPWSPMHPFYAKLSYAGDTPIGCSFTTR